MEVAVKSVQSSCIRGLCCLIFVAVGTHYQEFNRLLEAVDEIAPSISDEVIMQVGWSKYRPKNCKYFCFAKLKEFEDYVKKVDLVISHCGEGVVLLSLINKKPLIVVPRLKKYNEHTNDHQLELAKMFEKESRVTVVYDVDDLKDAIKNIKKNGNGIREKSKMIEMIRSYLAEL